MISNYMSFFKGTWANKAKKTSKKIRVKKQI